MSPGGECEAVVTVRARCGWVKFTECDELLHGKIFHLKLNLAVYKSYVMSSILYGGEAKCLNENNSENREIHSESNVWSAAQRQKNGYGLQA